MTIMNKIFRICGSRWCWEHISDVASPPPSGGRGSSLPLTRGRDPHGRGLRQMPPHGDRIDLVGGHGPWARLGLWPSPGQHCLGFKKNQGFFLVENRARETAVRAGEIVLCIWLSAGAREAGGEIRVARSAIFFPTKGSKHFPKLLSPVGGFISIVFYERFCIVKFQKIEKLRFFEKFEIFRKF